MDKAAVKGLVSKIIGKEYIIPTLYVWKDVNEIDCSKLPSKFVLKTTNGGGSNGVIVCRDKTTFNLTKAKRRLKRSLNTDINKYYKEWPYKGVEKRIIAEPLIENNDDSDLTDYKFFCFEGQPKYIQVIKDRSVKETIDFFNLKWEHLNFVGLNPNVENSGIEIPRPKYLDKMIELAHKLARGLKFVRVDFYHTDKGILFGELTFYPASGMGKFTPSEWDDRLGSMIKI